MIIELYVMLQVFAFAIFIISWFRRDLILWVLGVMLFGTQAFTSVNIQYLVTIVTSSTEYVTKSINVSNLPMMWLNVLLSILCVVMFFWDIYNPDNNDINMPNLK